MVEIEQSLVALIETARAVLGYPALPVVAAVAVFVASMFALGRTVGALGLNILAAVAVYWLVADAQERGAVVAFAALIGLVVALLFAYWRINMTRGGK